MITFLKTIMIIFSMLSLLVTGYMTYDMYNQYKQQETQTNNNVEYNTQEETTPPQEVQQQSYNDHIEEQANEHLPYSIDSNEAIRLSKVQPNKLSGEEKQTQQQVLSTAYENVKNGTGTDFDRQLINNIEQTHTWED